VVILHEDGDILVVEKPHGLLTVATERRTTGTLYSKLTEYVRKGNAKSRNRIFIVHRLDRDASGVLVFAKTIEAKTALQGGWEEARKQYLAVVHGHMSDQSGVIASHLIETKAQLVHSTRDTQQGKLSRTAYRVLQESGGRSLLEIDLLTGRKHQIRVHLSELGRPIVGDRKYGGKNDGEKRLALHAKSLAFDHPATRQRLEFHTETPEYFERLMRSPGAPDARNRDRPHAVQKKTARS
jgi:tRNA pseudouridine32 synthase/23S rRNA pseudouridine746 synthase/23S rRNA pseudouridine1911/1915/1917 synthase